MTSGSLLPGAPGQRRGQTGAMDAHQRKSCEMAKYTQINESDVPSGVRFDVPRRHQGQIIEVAYGGWGRYEHDDGAEYKREIDRSDRSAAYYRLVNLPADEL